ncbi:DUF481 domain-containing protein [Gelidibacter salicanalis]|uniref:DUF481 domain-containing protein n=1 Tax=Gelidibacter salicanalis TaxID=291193 RepID=A0A934KMY5_9FLAO|nr:DUF481 domain-containing protein [Gelidibacter salicanalis]MBJ7880684.1 DUF481 domain-containing protein [Gelidibacter salicanalis]
MEKNIVREHTLAIIRKWIFFLALLCSVVGVSQEESKAALKLFVDCNCDQSYIQQDINFVDHVRDQALANIKLFIYDIANGSGGRTYTLDFKGSGDYEGIINERIFDTNTNLSPDDVRKGLVEKVRSGLLKYVMESNLADKVVYKISDEGLAERQDIDFDDPWNNWLFEIYGEARLDKESSKKEFEYELGLKSDRVSEKWRIRSDFQMNQSNSRFFREDETFTSDRVLYSGEGSVVRSLSDHWSTGIFTGALHDTFKNLDFRYFVSTAVEYNIFPYNEVLRREITFAYKIGYFHNDYIEPTLFFQSQEGMFNHSLEVQLRFRQPWGNLDSRLRGSSFLNDFSKNSLQLYSSISVRVFKGLAVRFSGNFEIVHDQINLSGGSASIEDVLLRQKQIATDFELNLSIGLSYTFGSAFNTIINTRL